MHLIEFKHSDLPLFITWLHEPDIRVAFGDPIDWIEEVRAHLDADSWVKHFLAYAPEPMGFCQFYDTRQAPNGPWSSEPSGTAGIDFFIASAAERGRGQGVTLVRLLLERIERSGQFHGVIADPDPWNHASIRVLKRCGFMRQPSSLFRFEFK